MRFEWNLLESLSKINIISAPNPDVEELNESFDYTLFDRVYDGRYELVSVTHIYRNNLR